jgi:predicted transposase/invertase (TIGR01784 family)
MQFLDPKNDIPFKKIFGEHKNLCISLLNSLLELPAPIRSIEYRTPEQLPEFKFAKLSVVDVKCEDSEGRTFIVEMQLYWNYEFMKRLLLNACRAYSNQRPLREIKSKSKKKKQVLSYSKLKPVYALALLNEEYKPGNPNYRHRYRTINLEDPNDVMEGLEFLVIELPKFKAPEGEQAQFVKWLRFLQEMDDSLDNAPEDLMEDEEVGEAIELCRSAAYSEAELDAYNQFWDQVRIEQGLTERLEEALSMKEALGERLDETTEKLEEATQKLAKVEETNRKLTQQVQTLSAKDAELAAQAAEIAELRKLLGKG